MKFVVRDAEGIVTGVCACAQPGYAEEELADDHPDVVAFLNQPTPVDKRAAAIEALLASEAAKPDAPAEVKEYARVKP